MQQTTKRGGRPTARGKTEMVSLRLTSAVVTEVKALAQEELRSVTSQIEVLLREALAARKRAVKTGDQE
jgi:hypothetical protein